MAMIRRFATPMLVAAWAGGWILAFLAARDNLYFEPTDQAVRMAADSVPRGLAGCGLCIAAAAAQSGITRRLSWLLGALPGLVTGGLLAAEPGAHGRPFAAWVLITVLLAPAAVAAQSIRATTARNRSA